MCCRSTEDVATEAGLSPEYLDEQLEEDFIPILADKVQPWKLTFYSILGILDVDDVEGELPDRSEQEKRIATLQKFNAKYDRRATYRVLIQAMLVNGMVDDALQLCTALRGCRGKGKKALVALRSRLICNTDNICYIHVVLRGVCQDLLILDHIRKVSGGQQAACKIIKAT